MLDQVPADRPTPVVAEGLIMQKKNSGVRRAKATPRWGIDDPRELEAAGLTLVSTRNTEGFAPEKDWRYLPAFQRVYCRTMMRLPVIRNLGRLLHYRFGS